MKQQRTLLYAAMAIILAFGLYLMVPRSDSATTTVGQEQTQEISYQGIDGKNALELLRGNHQIETQKFDFGEMVLSINGRKAGNDEFWAFYVNGELAQVGAADYQTKSTDIISWNLEKIQ
jgi:hypothetical protein